MDLRTKRSDILLLNGELDFGLDRKVAKLMLSRRRHKSLHLVIVTEGGNADVAFKVGRCLQSLYDNVTAVVPGWCKSAGTLVCIGAHKLVIGDLGELGPLDVQIAKADDLGGRSSGLAIESAFRSLQGTGFYFFESCLLEIIQKSGGRITTKTAAELAVNMTVGFLSPIFQQMDPIKIGEDFRSTRVAEEYAKRLDIEAQNLIERGDFSAAEVLVRGYPSHAFVIDRTEAMSLFRRVEALNGALQEIVEVLDDRAINPLSKLRGERPSLEFLNDEQSTAEDDVRRNPSAARKVRTRRPRRAAKRRATNRRALPPTAIGSD